MAEAYNENDIKLLSDINMQLANEFFKHHSAAKHRTISWGGELVCVCAIREYIYAEDDLQHLGKQAHELGGKAHAYCKFSGRRLRDFHPF